MSKNTLLIGVLVAFLVACGVYVYPLEVRTLPMIVPEASAPGLVVLPVGRTGEVDGLFVRFDTLVTDNRCPVDVQCIEAGAVTARITLMSGDITETINLPQDQVPHEFAGYRISIEAVSPVAQSTVTIRPEEYIVTFRVEKKN